MLVESFSGIRGIYGTELDLNISEKYVYAYWLSFLKNIDNKRVKIVIGRDGRNSGEEIFKAFCNVLDCEILDLGVSATPVIENAVREFNCDGGIIITASHNEPEYNGFKFLGKDGAVLKTKEITKVIEKFKELSRDELNINLTNQIIKNYGDEALKSYIDFVKGILGEIDLKEIKILVDPNGGAGICSKKVFEAFGINANYINMEPGKFKRLVEPNLSSLSYLKEKLIEQGAEFAAGFDCDADRVEILLKDGSLMGGNEILGIITEDILSKHNGKPVVVNDATSYVVKEIANKYNSNFIEVEVGETNVVEEMKRVGSLVGGEGSNGGVIVGNSKCRDGILGVLYLLKILIKHKTNLNSLINKLPKYYYLKYKFKLNKDFSLIRKELIEYYLEKGFEVMMTGDSSGGLKFLKNQSWVWFRQSKTEDKMIRIVTNSKDEEIAENLLKEARILLQQAF